MAGGFPNDSGKHREVVVVRNHHGLELLGEHRQVRIHHQVSGGADRAQKGPKPLGMRRTRMQDDQIGGRHPLGHAGKRLIAGQWTWEEPGVGGHPHERRQHHPGDTYGFVAVQSTPKPVMGLLVPRVALFD